MVQYNKPLPEITLLTEPFWQGTKEHQLRLQRCDDCGTFRFTPKEVCPSCASVQATWTPVSGAGTVYSYSTVYRGTGSAFQEDLPFVVVMVELKEGPRVISHLIDCPPRPSTDRHACSGGLRGRHTRGEPVQIPPSLTLHISLWNSSFTAIAMVTSHTWTFQNLDCSSCKSMTCPL